MIGCVRNSDEHLRRLEREAASGDPSAQMRLAVAQERTDGAVADVRSWIEAQLEKANAVSHGDPMTEWGTRRFGLLGPGLVRDAVFRAGGHEVYGTRGEQPDPELPLRSFVYGAIGQRPSDVMEEFDVDGLTTTYALAAQSRNTPSGWRDHNDVVLAIKAAPGWSFHGPDPGEGFARVVTSPEIEKAWPSLDRAMAEERHRHIGHPGSAVAAARSVWRSWLRAQGDDRIRIPMAIVDRWLMLERAENQTAPNPPRDKRIPVRICKVADEAHRTSGRAYAHVFCGPGSTICVASAFFELPREHRDGILAHELGHLFAGTEGDEPAADAAFLERTGVKIRYKDGRHGQCLQCLSPADSRRLEGRFDFDFSGRLTGVETDRDETSIDYVVEVTSRRPFSKADLARAMRVDPSEIGGDDRWRGRVFEWKARSLSDAAQQAAAVRRTLSRDWNVRAFARESDDSETRELGWSA